ARVKMLGSIGGGLIVAGWLAAIPSRIKLTARQRLILATCAVATLGYWLAFANIIVPHGYYSLIVIPFCSISAGVALNLACSAIKRSLALSLSGVPLTAAAATLCSAASVVSFLAAGGFGADRNAMEFERLSSGKFERFSF